LEKTIEDNENENYEIIRNIEKLKIEKENLITINKRVIR